MGANSKKTGGGSVVDQPDFNIEVKNLADLIEGSKYEIIEDSGHIPCVDNPAVLSKLIIDFIK